MGGAQDATMTFLAPTSFAIWMISFEVVPRTIESTAEKEASLSVVVFWKHSSSLTINQHHVLTSKLHGHRIELLPDILSPIRRAQKGSKSVSSHITWTTANSPHGLTRHDKSAADISVLDETFPVRDVEMLSDLQSCDTGGIRNLLRITLSASHT